MVPLPDVEAVLERARRFRAMQWTEFDTLDLVLRDILAHVNASPLIMRMPGGWIEVGKIGDTWSGPWWLRTWWHELSNRVRVERPPEPKPLPVPPNMAPLRMAEGTTADSRRIVALPGFVYTYEGRDYSPEEAERLLAQLGSLDGWTWRKCGE